MKIFSVISAINSTAILLQEFKEEQQKSIDRLEKINQESESRTDARCKLLLDEMKALRENLSQNSTSYNFNNNSIASHPFVNNPFFTSSPIHSTNRMCAQNAKYIKLSSLSNIKLIQKKFNHQVLPRRQHIQSFKFILNQRNYN